MLTLVLTVIPYLARLQRAAMIDVLDSEYVQMARLKGVRERTVIRRHALRNSVVPIIQGSALTLIYLTGGIVTIEYLFAFPGLGSALAHGRAEPRPPGRAGHRAALRARATWSSTCSPTCSRSTRRRGSGRGSGDERAGRQSARPRRRAVALAGADAARCASAARASASCSRRPIVLIALIGPLVAPHDRPRSSASRSSRHRATSRWARTTSATTSSRACSGAGAASSGWRSRPPRSASAVGAALGMLAGFSRSRLDDGLMRSMDVILAFPQIVLVLLFVSMLGSHSALIVALVALAWVPQVARVARGVTADIVHREYVQAAEAIGLPAPPHPLPRDPAERRDAADGRVRPAPHLVDRRDRGGQLPRLRHPAAERRLGPDDQREPGGITVQPWAVLAPALCIALFAIGTNFITEGVSRAVAGVDRRR